jgi:hypothetical protein
MDLTTLAEKEIPTVDDAEEYDQNQDDYNYAVQTGSSIIENEDSSETSSLAMVRHQILSEVSVSESDPNPIT